MALNKRDLAKKIILTISAAALPLWPSFAQEQNPATGSTDSMERSSRAVIYKSDSTSVPFTNEWQQFTLTSQDHGTGVSRILFRLNNGKITQYREPISLQQSGLNQIEYFAEDLAGNREASHLFQMILDRQPPQLAFELDESANFKDGIWYVKKATRIMLAATDDLSGIKTVYLNRGSGEQIVTPNQSMAVERNGVMQYTAWAMDNTLNRSRSVDLRLISDDTAPILQILSQYRRYNELKFCPIEGHLVLEASDDLAGIDKIVYKRPGDTMWRRYLQSILIPRGEKTFQVVLKAIDRSGNETAAINYECANDQSKPHTQIQLQ
ncbi:MAG: hypothetical protein KDK39_04135 [Leptospiraceae bacterium]|nr:hypothetical protein [Leptospiraceae bacterium]